MNRGSKPFKSNAHPKKNENFPFAVSKMKGGLDLSPQNAGARKKITRSSFFEGIRVFAAAVGTTAILMLTLCGVFDLYLEDPTAQKNVRTASVLGTTETAAFSHTVQLGGDVFGIKLFSDGVIVASLSEIYANGTACCPAKDAGIEAGDYVLRVNGESVETNADLKSHLTSGKPVELLLRRDDKTYTATVTPCLSDGTYKIGMWIRDSAAGIGTVTFYSEDGTHFAGLGHGICDADTKNVLAIRSGEPAPVSICGIQRGISGAPGRLRGYFSDTESLGRLIVNDETGIYGTLDTAHTAQTVEIAPRETVHTGNVQIAATIDENGVQYFDAVLERIAQDSRQDTKTLVLRVTDAELLAETGGIVQGMSGCPILQDGKLIGAVTHVFVDEPTRGYGIFAETMLEKSIAILNK